ncbi:hypothetical protein [Novosphingobium sp. AAP83]|uniref:hypothetical protein n=1 Tax=Novosphingobium sp. AAP83 TaxID=1523425 RepID=UPI0018D1B480|nr:hypothetical protein [Novosphingobium sp. AAP83]
MTLSRLDLPLSPVVPGAKAGVSKALAPMVLAQGVRPDRPLVDLAPPPPPGLWAQSAFVGEPRAGATGHAEALPDQVSAPPRVVRPNNGKRWSFDQWLLMREGGGDPAQAVGAASYGASQAGGIARYRLGKAAPHSSFAYLRTSLAIDAPGNDREIALGFGMRPVSRVPLRVLAEARLYDSKASPARVRPVLTVVTELPWQEMGAGFRAEAYGQAGYAGGTEPTAFFDVQAVVDRSLGKAMGPLREVRLGAGLWAGGQKGAVRLDVGPRVSVPLALGAEVSSRIALDWRLQVAGNARPVSGPALTLASSF